MGVYMNVNTRVHMRIYVREHMRALMRAYMDCGVRMIWLSLLVFIQNVYGVATVSRID